MAVDAPAAVAVMADVMAIGAVAAVVAGVRATKSGHQEVKRLLERGAFFGVTEAF